MENLKQEILNKVEQYCQIAHKRESYKDGMRINYAGRVFDSREVVNLVDSALDFWLTASSYAREFEAKLAQYLGINYALMVNSGSSANLLAFATLTSHLLGTRAIKRGDEVITVAAGFPTTIAPIVQFGAIPVFLDINLDSANLDISALDSALSPKTKAVFLAHTLGNPFDLGAIKDFCKKHNLWLIEDNCDALGAEFAGQKSGTFGDIGTSSFYPAHHITTGEGGAIYTNNALLKKIAQSIRDWGRDCWCEGGRDNSCGARFAQMQGKLPFGYDHKYIYSHFGYNLKATEMQAAIGVAQLEKLESFVAKRRENHAKLNANLAHLEDIFILPKAHQNALPSWFGFLIILRDNALFSRNEISEFLESQNIQTRNLFGGNMLLHPAFDALKEGIDYRVVGDLKNTNKIMHDGFWVGVYPALGEAQMDFIARKINEFVMQKTNAKNRKTGGGPRDLGFVVIFARELALDFAFAWKFSLVGEMLSSRESRDLSLCKAWQSSKILGESNSRESQILGKSKYFNDSTPPPSPLLQGEGEDSSCMASPQPPQTFKKSLQKNQSHEAAVSATFGVVENGEIGFRGGGGDFAFRKKHCIQAPPPHPKMLAERGLSESENGRNLDFKSEDSGDSRELQILGESKYSKTHSKTHPITPSAREGEFLDSLDVAQTHLFFALQKVRKKTLNFGDSREFSKISPTTNPKSCAGIGDSHKTCEVLPTLIFQSCAGISDSRESKRFLPTFSKSKWASAQTKNKTSPSLWDGARGWVNSQKPKDLRKSHNLGESKTPTDSRKSSSTQLIGFLGGDSHLSSYSPLPFLGGGVGGGVKNPIDSRESQKLRKSKNPTDSRESRESKRFAYAQINKIIANKSPFADSRNIFAMQYLTKSQKVA